MLNPVRLNVHKKTLVPTKYQRNHNFRSDWKLVASIHYDQSKEIFTRVGNGPIVTDAQFAKMLYDNFGEGEYMVLAWKKGREGFWNFFKAICSRKHYMRTERKVTREQKEARENLRDHKRLQVELSTAKVEKEKEEIMNEVKAVEDMMSLNKEIINLSKGNRRGPYPYLKTIQPIYKEHEYGQYEKEHKGEAVDMEAAW